jgi:diacylglycerol kinase
MNKTMNVAARIASFKYALQGIRQLISNEPNMKIHFVAAMIAVLAGFAKGLTSGQWVALTLTIGLVWLCEAFNTALEILCDLVCNQQYNTTIKAIKDISAGAVLIAATVSVLTGIFIFTS